MSNIQSDPADMDDELPLSNRYGEPTLQLYNDGDDSEEHDDRHPRSGTD